MTELRGERVLLRPFRPEEFDTALAARRRDMEFLPSRVGMSEDAFRRRLALSGTMTRFELLLAIEAGGRLVGEIQGRRAEDVMPSGLFELGIEIYEGSDRGKAYGSEAVALLTSHLFEREGAHRVQASTDTENQAMRRVLERLAFSFEGVLRGFMPTTNGPRDYAIYGMTKTDYEEVSDRWTRTS